MKSKEVKRSETYMIGTVVKTGMDKTVVVMIETRKMHPLYKKGMKFTKKYKVHCETKVAVGDAVKIAQTRPISKEKRWIVAEVMKK